MLARQPNHLAERLPTQQTICIKSQFHTEYPYEPCFRAFLAQYGVQKRTNNLYPTPVILEATRTRGRSILKAALSPVEGHEQKD